MTGYPLPTTIWQRELIEFVARRRAMVIKLAFPLVVGLPLVFSRVQPLYAALALTMLVAMIGAVGSGQVLARERAVGLSVRYRLLPRRLAGILLERIGSSAVIDLLQILPILVVIGLRHPARLAWWPGLVLATAAVLLATNVLGAWASTLTTSPGEVMLAVLLPLLPLLFLSGVFTPPADPALQAISSLLPFTYLHDALLGSLDGRPLLAPWVDVLGGLACVVVAAGAAAVMSRRVLEAD
jgi:ABC-type multidrug transport system permease subunit